jgi:transcriptional regulator with XRE-family HTH domain
MGHNQSRPGPVGLRLARQISSLRVAHGWTQAHLADLTYEFGRPIETQTLGRIERGLRKIDVDDVHVLACAFNMTASALLQRATR